MIITFIVLFVCGGFLHFTLTGVVDVLPTNDFISWLIILLCSVMLVFELSNRVKEKSVYITLLIGYFLRIIILLWIVYFSNIFQLPNTGSDNLFFHSLGVMKAQGVATTRSYLYTDVLGLLYSLFNGRIIIGSYINILISLYSVIILYDTFNRLEIINSWKKKGITLFILWPNFMILSCVTLREPIIIFLVTLSLSSFVSWWQSNRRIYFLLSLMYTLIGALFHSGVLFVMTGYIIGFILFQNNRINAEINTRSVFACIIVFFFMAIAMNLGGDMLASKFQNFESISNTVEDVANSRGGSGYSVGLPIGNPILNLIINTPIRLVFFLFSPLAWRGIADIIAFLSDSVLYFILTFHILKNMKVSIKNNKIILVVLISLMVTSILFSWGVSNAGTALRHRTKLLTLFIFIFIICKGKLYDEQFNKKV